MTMELALVHGEGLTVPERVIVAPSVGVFRPLFGHDAACGQSVDAGQAVGVIEGPGISTPVRSPFRGILAGLLANDGERLEPAHRPQAFTSARSSAARKRSLCSGRPTVTRRCSGMP